MIRLLATIIGLVVGTSILGAEVAPTARPYTLVQVSLVSGESAGVLSKDFAIVDFATTTNGIVWTGPPGRYAVVVSGGPQGLQILPVEITGDLPPVPPPPVPPTPPAPDPLDGIAGRLYPLIIAANDKPTANKLAANYRAVLSDVDAGTIRSVMVARTKLAHLNGGTVLAITWKPAIDGMLRELNGVLDLPTLQRVFRGTIAALERAGQ